MIPIINSIKLEPNEEPPFLNFAQQSNRSDQINGFNVRPWISQDTATKPALYLVTQFALYKCMHDDCLFSTDKEEKWMEHMNDHMKLIDVLQNNGDLSNEMRRKNIKFRECPYCKAELRSNDEVSRHIETEHRRSLLQCKHCYYRANEMDNIVLHHENCHAEQSREVLLIDGKREFEDEDKAILQDGFDLYVKQFKCGKRTNLYIF